MLHGVIPDLALRQVHRPFKPDRSVGRIEVDVVRRVAVGKAWELAEIKMTLRDQFNVILFEEFR